MEHWQSQCNAIGADAVDITPESREFGRFGATWHQASKGPNVRRSDSSSAAAVPHLPLPKQGHGVTPSNGAVRSLQTFCGGMARKAGYRRAGPHLA
jgi:hypothetical protein